MYTRRTSFKKVFDNFKSMGACEPAPSKFFEPFLKANPRITFGEVIDKFAAGEYKDVSEGWVVWLS